MLSILRQIKVIALDLDGVVYAGEEPLEGAALAIEEIRSLGIPVYFVTNNSSKTRGEIAHKLAGMGIPANADEVVTSGYAAALLVKDLSSGRPSRILVIGSEGLRAEIARQRIAADKGGDYDFVLVGLNREFRYSHICSSLNALLGGAKLIACNRDTTYPVEGGRLMPGCGPLVAAIEVASGRKADYEVGKPNPSMLKIVAQRSAAKPHEILVVGDVFESDVKMAKAFGSPSALITNDLNCHPSGIQPSINMKSLSELSAKFKEKR